MTDEIRTDEIVAEELEAAKKRAAQRIVQEQGGNTAPQKSAVLTEVEGLGSEAQKRVLELAEQDQAGALARAVEQVEREQVDADEVELRAQFEAEIAPYTAGGSISGVPVIWKMSEIKTKYRKLGLNV